MFKCDNCDTELDSFALKQNLVLINGVKYLISYFECPCCNKPYVVDISVGKFREEWMALIDAKQELREVLRFYPENTEEVKHKRDRVESIIDSIKSMARKGQKLMSLLNT